MAQTAAFISCLIIAVKAEASYRQNEEHVSSQWRTAAIALGVLLVFIAIITAIKKCLTRLLVSRVVDSDDEEPQISIISSNGLSNGTRNGKENMASNIQVNNAQSDSKHLTLDMDLAQKDQNRSPSISVEPPTPRCGECTLEDAQSITDASTTEWVTSTPPPPPPGTLLWIPSTARRRSVSLRGDSEEEKDQKSVCSSCGGSLSQTHSPSMSPPNSMTLERKRSVTFNQSVEEIHVLSDETKRPKSRSPILFHFM